MLGKPHSQPATGLVLNWTATMGKMMAVCKESATSTAMLAEECSSGQQGQ